MFGAQLGSLYCNTVLANLNVRAYVGGEETTNVVDVAPYRGCSFQLEITKTDRQHTSGEAMSDIF